MIKLFLLSTLPSIRVYCLLLSRTHGRRSSKTWQKSAEKAEEIFDHIPQIGLVNLLCNFSIVIFLSTAFSFENIVTGCQGEIKAA